MCHKQKIQNLVMEAQVDDFQRFKGWVARQKVVVDKTNYAWVYYQWGPKDAEPIFMFHGATGTADCFYNQFLCLCPKGYHIISVRNLKNSFLTFSSTCHLTLFIRSYSKGWKSFSLFSNLNRSVPSPFCLMLRFTLWEHLLVDISPNATHSIDPSKWLP
jgi:hypothetical protein